MRHSIQAWHELGQPALAAHELENFAYIARMQSQPQRTVRLLGAAEAVQERIGTSAVGLARLQGEYQSTLDWLQTQMNEAVSVTLWSEGCGMTMDQAISYALEQ